jgi:Protein of unknown function (DUF2769).
MEKIIVTDEAAQNCRCLDCATFKINKLNGGVFCAHGPHKKMVDVEVHNGCNCNGCPVREEGQFFDVLFCMNKPSDIVREMNVERVDVDARVDAVTSGSSHVQM